METNECLKIETNEQKQRYERSRRKSCSCNEIQNQVGMSPRMCGCVVMCCLLNFIYSSMILLPIICGKAVREEWTNVSRRQYNWIGFFPGLTDSLSGIFWGSFMDTRGRLPTLYISAIVSLLGTLLCCISPSFGYFLLFYSLTRLGGSPLQSLAYVYAAEMFPENVRGRLSSVVSVFGGIGIVSVAAIHWLVEGVVRLKMFLVISFVLPHVFSLFVICIVAQETPMFLVGKGRVELAWKVLNKLCSPKKRTSLAQKSSQVNLVVVHPTEESSLLQTLKNEEINSTMAIYRKLFQRAYIYKALLFGSYYFLNTLGYTSILAYLPEFYRLLQTDSSGILNSSGMMFLAMAVQTLGVCFGMTFIDASASNQNTVGKKSRRKIVGRGVALVLLTGGEVAILLFYSFMIAIRSTQTFFLSLLGGSIYFCIAPIWAVLAIFTPESFPTEIRASAVSLTRIMGGIPGLLSFFIGDIVVDFSRNHLAVFPTVWAIVYLLFFCLSWLSLCDRG